MPAISCGTYRPPYPGGHLQTILPKLFRKRKPPAYERERVTTPDNDFIDLDWIKKGRPRLALLLHGLEGSSYSQYIRGTVNVLSSQGWDSVAMNFRGCSGEINALLRSYHSGATEDLHFVIEHILAHHKYKKINLIGFSLGGNLLLKYLGENKYKLPHAIQACVAVSTPCDLQGSAYTLGKWQNRMYLRRFLRSMKKKIKKKEKKYPGSLNYHKIYAANDFEDFDDHYTGPVHGFKNADNYWRECSCKQFIPHIKTPTLLVNALNDPFLPETCYPIREAGMNPCFEFLMPRHGGHIGFPSWQMRSDILWHEKAIYEFIS